jgi:hypothetical protein
MSHLSVQKKLDSFFKPALLYVQKQVQLLSLLSMNKCTAFFFFFLKKKALQ